MIKEADLRDFGKFGEAVGKIKVTFAWCEVAGWKAVCHFSAVGRPEVCGNATPRPFELDGGVLALGDKFLYLFALHH